MTEQIIINLYKLRYGEINWSVVNNDKREEYLKKLELQNRVLYEENAEPVLYNKNNNDVIFKTWDSYVIVDFDGKKYLIEIPAFLYWVKTGFLPT